MVSHAVATSATDARTERYRQAERRLWDRFDLRPTEHIVELDAPATRLRVLEVGTGRPVLFVHGTAGLGAWPGLLAQLRGLRCLILERPGWGLSSAIDYSGQEYRRLTAGLLAGVLDALGVERASVASASIGNVWALSLAAADPARVDRLALIGGGSPLVADFQPPRIIRLLASPLGALIVRLPPKRRMELAQLRQNGHGASLDAGRIPGEFIEWRLAMARETDSMRHERDMARALLGKDGWRPGVTFDVDELTAIKQPTLYVWGSADPAGSREIWQRVTGALPAGELHVVEGAGHTPWLDEPDRVGDDVGRFLMA
jgi:2-hydroxy-6-oxonona-2,4-dienedioate hydrolase